MICPFYIYIIYHFPVSFKKSKELSEKLKFSNRPAPKKRLSGKRIGISQK